MTHLTQRLASLRQRIIALGLASGLAWGLVAALALLVAWMWVDLGLELSSAARAIAPWAALLCLIALAIRFALAAKDRATLGGLARKLDETAGTHGQILTGIELSASQSGTVQGTTLTAGLAAMAIERADSLASHVATAQAAPASALRRPLMALAIAAAIILIIAALAPRLVSTQLARIFDPYGDHPPYSNIHLTVEPGDVQVIYGRGFDIRMSAPDALIDKAEVVLGETGEALPMFDEGGGKWRATVASVTEPTRYFVRARNSKTKSFNVAVITVPRLENVRVRITPPAYTHRPVYEGPVPQGGLFGLAGTKVQFFATSNRPLSGGSIEHDAGPRFAMTGSGSEATAQFEIDKPGKITLRVTDAAGQSSDDSFTTTITVLKDERPFVRMMLPQSQSFATPTTSLPIELNAEDDFGIARLQVYRSLNDSRPLPADLPVSPTQPTRVTGIDQLPLAGFGLKPGDIIKVFARVEDNDPAGPKGSESSVAIVRIISEEDFKRMVLTREGMETLQSKYAQAQRRMESLAEEMRELKEEIDKKEKTGEIDEANRQKLEDLATRLEQEAAEVAQSAKEELPFDLDKALAKHLEEVAKKMREAAEATSKLAQKKPQDNAGASKALEEMAKKLAGDRQEFQEQAMDPLEHLAKVFPLIEDQARFVQLYEAQKDLAQRLASIKTLDRVEDPKEKARLRDLEEEQNKLREELKDLLDDIESHARELPEDPRLDDLRKTALDFVDAVRQTPAEDRMLDAELALNEFNGKSGYGNALAAEEILAQFLSKCKSMEGEGQACLKFQPGLAAGLGDTVNQLLEAAGLSSGPGSSGSSGGYSARRNSLRNVGLYGQISRMSQESRSGGGKSDRAASGISRGQLPGEGDPSNPDAAQGGRATGDSDAGVPLKYKRRVGDYFRRVADEIGED